MSEAGAIISVLKDKRVGEFISLSRIAHLATADAAAVPHNVPLCFCFDGTNFYTVIDEKPKRQKGVRVKRIRNITANRHVALIIDHYEEDWSQLAYVLVHGQAAVVEDSEEYLAAVRLLRDKYSQYRSMALTPENNLMVRIEPLAVHIWGARFNTTSTKPNS